MMKKNFVKLFSLLLALSLLLGLAACGGDSGSSAAQVADDIVNGDFEEVSEGQWVGWTRHDAAFNFRGVVNNEKIKGVTMEKSARHPHLRRVQARRQRLHHLQDGRRQGQ